MKTRSGFVSNSSSSSFIVKAMDDSFAKKPKKALTAGQTRLLKKNGFQLSLAYYPDQVDYGHSKKLSAADKRFANWTRFVSCNQEDEITFLLKNQISFSADLHYGHRSMEYDGKTDVLIISQNFGKQIQMWGTEKMKFTSSLEREPVHRTTGKAYLKLHKIVS